MKERIQKIIAPDEWVTFIVQKISLKDIKVALSVFLFGLCIYIPMITKRLSCNDGTLCGLIYRSHTDYDLEDMMGRYLLKWFAHLKSMYVFSWLAVIVAIVCVVVSAILTCRILYINDSIKMMMVGLLMMVSPCFIETFSYYFITDIYIISFLLAVIAVYLLHEKKSASRAIFAIFLMFLSMGFYQAYIFVAVVLFLFVLIRDLLDEKKEWKEILIGLAWQMGSGLTAFTGYVLCEKLFKTLGIIYYKDSRFDFAEIFNIKAFPNAIANAYRYFYQYFFTMDFINNQWKARHIINAVVLLLGIISLIYLMIKKQKKWTFNIAVVIAVILLPIAFMGITVMNWQESAIRLMMIPTMCMFYVGVWALWNEANRVYKSGMTAICGWGLYLLSAYLLVIMTVYIGIYQICAQYYVDKTDSMAQRIISRIEQEYPETVTGSPVFICGDVDEGNYPQDYRITQATYIMKGTQACDGVMLDNMQGYAAGWNIYMNINFGVDYGIAWDKAQEIYDSEFYKEMPLFPAEGSIKKTPDGIVVVKMKH